MARVVFVGGPSGCGKTTVGKMVSEEVSRGAFVEGDDLHGAENLHKMRSGIPLEDGDRWPWLERVVAEANRQVEELDANKSQDGDAFDESLVVVTCSMLKKRYRDFIRKQCPSARLVILVPEFERVAMQMEARQGHFFKRGMLESQYRDFEIPLVVSGTHGDPHESTTIDGATEEPNTFLIHCHAKPAAEIASEASALALGIVHAA